MRIAYLHQYFNTPVQSGSTRSYEFAKRMVSRGHEVHIVTSDRGAASKSTRWSHSIVDGIHVHSIGVRYNNDMSFHRRIFAFASFALRSIAKTLSLKPDLVFASSTPLTIGIPGLVAKYYFGCPLVFEVRDLWPEMPIAVGAIKNSIAIRLARWFEGLIYRSSRYVVALSPGMADGVIQRGTAPERVVTIPNSADIGFFTCVPGEVADFCRQFAWLGNRPLVAYCGTLGVVNDVGYLARLAAAVYPLNPEIRFLVVGDGKEKEAIRRTAMELEVYEKNFFMLNALPKKDVVKIFCRSTVTCSLFAPIEAMWKNSANKFFDGLAAGRPVVINHGGWIAELINDRDIGLVLDTDMKSSALKLVEKIEHPTWCKMAGERSHALAKEKFARDDLASALISVLESAI